MKYNTYLQLRVKMQICKSQKPNNRYVTQAPTAGEIYPEKPEVMEPKYQQ